jgi:hypothetical protein
MPIRHLADAESLALLRFWTQSRGAADLPEWSDVSQLPVELLPNVAVTHRRPQSVFIYAGSEILRRWGGGITGAEVYSEVIRGEHAAYLRSLGNDAVQARKPVFSAALFSQPGAPARTMIARLYAPFSYRASAEPTVIVGLQIVERETEINLREAVFEEEVDRRAVGDPAGVAERLAPLRAARRDGRVEDTAVTSALARLQGSALITLTRFAAARR